MLSKRDPPQTQGHTKLKVGAGKIYSMQKKNQEKVGVVILISDKIDIKIKVITTDKDEH